MARQSLCPHLQGYVFSLCSFWDVILILLRRNPQTMMTTTRRLSLSAKRSSAFEHAAAFIASLCIPHRPSLASCAGLIAVLLVLCCPSLPPYRIHLYRHSSAALRDHVHFPCTRISSRFCPRLAASSPEQRPTHAGPNIRDDHFARVGHDAVPLTPPGTRVAIATLSADADVFAAATTTPRHRQRTEWERECGVSQANWAVSVGHRRDARPCPTRARVSPPPPGNFTRGGAGGHMRALHTTSFSHAAAVALRANILLVSYAPAGSIKDSPIWIKAAMSEQASSSSVRSLRAPKGRAVI
jgi:hypothetical protein